MSKATFTFGRFNVPTEEGHGKLISAVQKHAEETGGSHYVFPSHSQDKKKNPLAHGEKAGFMRKLFPSANVVSNDKVRTAIDAMKHLESKGHTHVTMVVGSDRVDEFHGLLTKYRKKEFPGIKKVSVVSAGNRDPDAEGAEGMSASKLRGLVAAGKRKEFISHYSDPELGAQIHDRAKAGMQIESTNPVGIFLIGSPGSGKDYVLNNIFSRFDLTEVQVDHILNGSANELIEQNKNIVINGAIDDSKINVVASILEGYNLDTVYVSVSNKVSRLRNSLRENPLAENKRIDKFLKAEKLAESLEEKFVFNNSINLNESTEFERVFFADQIEKLLNRLINEHGLEMRQLSEAKTFNIIREKTKEPTGSLKNACWTGYTAIGMKTKNGRKVPNCVPVKEQVKGDLKVPHTIESIAEKHSVAQAEVIQALAIGKQVEMEHTKDEKTAETIALAHLFEKPDYYTQLAKMEQFTGDIQDKLAHYTGPENARKLGRARRISHFRDVHRYEREGHKAAVTNEEKEEDVNVLFERQLLGTDEYRIHAIAMTPGQNQEIENAYEVLAQKSSEENCGCDDTDNSGDCDCVKEEANVGRNTRNFREFRASFKEAKGEVELPPTADVTPTLTKKRKGSNTITTPSRLVNPAVDGLPVASRLTGEQVELKEAVEYHLSEGISFTENAFRPGSDMFFEMINVAKDLYEKGEYSPKDEWEVDMLNSDIGEVAIYEGQEVILDYPFEEKLNESRDLPITHHSSPHEGGAEDDEHTDRFMGSVPFDPHGRASAQRFAKYVISKGGSARIVSRGGEHYVYHKGVGPITTNDWMKHLGEDSDPTNGKGIGKPWREGGGGAVYVRDGDSIRKIRFSQSGMAKKYNDPARVRSFVARHRCLTNKDKTSASYWACRWPRFFSNSGKIWW